MAGPLQIWSKNLFVTEAVADAVRSCEEIAAVVVAVVVGVGAEVEVVAADSASSSLGLVRGQNNTETGH